MLALIFESPERLWWSFVLLVPLLIHLLRRRRFQQQAWAAMQFLLQAMEEESQKARLRNLSLMILRALILACFLAAISAPRSDTMNLNPGKVSDGTYHVLVIDASYSMNTTDSQSGESAFELAKQKAIEYTRGIAQGDVVSVLTIGEFERWVIEVPASDFQQAALAIDELEPQPTGGSLKTVLASALDLVTDARKSDPDLLVARVVVFTDMEQNLWDEMLNDGQHDSSQDLLRQFGQVAVVDCSVNPAANLAIKNLTISYPQGAFASQVSILAEVDCYYKTAETATGVSWFVDNEFVRRDEIEIGEQQSATVSLPLQDLSAGRHQIEARLDDDSLMLDNSQWIVFESPASFRVLCIEGERGDADAVELALHPTDDPDWPVTIQQISEAELEQQILTDFDVVALCGVNISTELNERRLRGFVHQGGTLLVTPGRNPNIKSLNRFFDNQDQDLGFGFRWKQVSSGPTSDETKMSVRAGDHKIVELFKQNPENGLGAIPIYKYVEVELRESGQAQVVLESDDGKPLYLYSPFGKGCLLTFSTSILISQEEERWSDLGVWPSFLPLLHETLKFVVGRRAEHADVLLGSAPEYGVSMQYGPLDVHVQNPDGSLSKYDLEFKGNQYSSEVFAYWWHHDFESPGIYHVDYLAGAKTVDSSLIAGNLKVTESDHQLLQSSVLDTLIESDINVDEIAQFLPTTLNQTWFQPLLLVTLGLLLLEIIWVSRVMKRSGKPGEVIDG